MEVHLQFTQEDRDMLRDTHSDVQRVLLAMADHSQRVATLETWKIRVVAIATFVGFIAGLAAKFIPIH